MEAGVYLARARAQPKRPEIQIAPNERRPAASAARGEEPSFNGDGECFEVRRFLRQGADDFDGHWHHVKTTRASPDGEYWRVRATYRVDGEGTSSKVYFIQEQAVVRTAD